jgi:hypothetical protein
MKKIMEVYQVENGIMLKKYDHVYHLFSGTKVEENYDSFKIATKEEAIQFMLNFFDGLNLKVQDKISPESTMIQRYVSFTLGKPVINTFNKF